MYSPTNNIINGPELPEHNEHTTRAVEALAGAVAANANAIAEIARSLRGPEIRELCGVKITGGES